MSLRFLLAAIVHIDFAYKSRQFDKIPLSINIMQPICFVCTSNSLSKVTQHTLINSQIFFLLTYEKLEHKKQVNHMRTKSTATTTTTSTTAAAADARITLRIKKKCMSLHLLSPSTSPPN